jgi:hypothetical protein
VAKYMILFNSDATARELMANASPEEMKASMDEWVKWRDEAIKSVKFEFGLPLQAVNSISPEAATESRNPASGYATIEGDSKDVITQLLKTHPHLKRTGSSIDLLEMIPMPGM